MTYDETLRYLYASAPLFQQIGAGAYKEGLETTRTLDAHFGHPHRKYLTIHIGGTNGKGTCSHSVAAVLQTAGYRVGLYTSPHLVDFRERIRVDGVPMPEAYVVDFVARERSFFEPLRPSFFELTTAMAFKYFADAAVDIAVVEVGLGGRLDCTNIVQPVLSVVTNISLDHTQFLGHTLAAIAGEKAGIFKAGTPAVVGEATPETRPVFTDAAARVGASLVFAEDAPEVLAVSRDAADEWRFESRTFGSVRSSLTGAYQERNMNTLLTALRELGRVGVRFSADDVRAGLAQVQATTGLRGRWETLRQAPTVVCDTGHNVGAWQYLAPQLRAQRCRRLRVVFGMAGDKDVRSVLALLPRDAAYYFTQASVRRALPAADLLREAEACGLAGAAYPTVASAYTQALADADADDFLFVGGSSFVVADLLAFLQSSRS